MRNLVRSRPRSLCFCSGVCFSDVRAGIREFGAVGISSGILGSDAGQVGVRLGTLGGGQTTTDKEGMVLARWKLLRRNERDVLVGTLGVGAGILCQRVGVGDAETGGTGP